MHMNSSITALQCRCVTTHDLVSARHLQCLIILQGLHTTVFWNDHLIRLFSMCGNLDEANRIFSKVSDPSIFTWNAIISAHGKLGAPEKAMDLYAKMHMGGVFPDTVTYLCALKASCSLHEMIHLRLIHQDLVKRGMDVHVNIGSTLVHSYSKCGHLEDAQILFDMLPSRNVVTWGAMISGYVHNDRGNVALDLFKSMQEQGIAPSTFTFSCALKACASAGAIDEGMLLHIEIMRQSLEADVVIGSTLVGMYFDCGSVEDANRSFDGLQNRDVICWVVLISGYVAHGLSSQVFEIFKRMRLSSLEPNTAIYISMLQAAGCTQIVLTGRLIHHDITENELEPTLSIGNSVIDMYAKCGCFHEACHTFECLLERDLVSWGALISGYVEYGEPRSALNFFGRMLRDGTKPNNVILLYGLKASAIYVSSFDGRCMHDLILEYGLESEETLGNALIDAYAQFGYLIDARSVFDVMSERSETSWGFMFRAYAENGHETEVLPLYREMQVQGLKPNKVMLLSIIKSCITSGTVRQGLETHEDIIRGSLESDVTIGTSLSEMYLARGSLEDAWKVFQSLPEKDVVLFGAMIEGLSLRGHSSLAFPLFADMQEAGIAPSSAVFLSMLKACRNIDAPEWSFIIHHNVVECRLETDAEIRSSLVSLYSTCGCLIEARRVFDDLENFNVVTWSALISGYVQHEHIFTAMELYEKILEEGIQPDTVLYSAILAVFMNIGALGHARSIHGELVKTGLDSDRIIMQQLADSYARYGTTDEAQSLLSDLINWQMLLHDSNGLTESTYCTSNSSCTLEAAIKDLHPAIQTFFEPKTFAKQLLESESFDSSNIYSGTLSIQFLGSIIDLLSRVGLLDESECFIKTIPMSPDIIAWVTLLSNCKNFGAFELGRECFFFCTIDAGISHQFNSMPFIECSYVCSTGSNNS